MIELIKRAVLASILIGLGDYVLLKIGAPLGAFIFAFGLYGVCMLGANLFTGKCGFVLEDKKWRELGIILIVNLIAGWLVGYLFSLADPTVHEAAVAKVATWELSGSFFIRSVLCGMIMYIAVKCYKLGSVWGIFFGVPLFILAGFQHSIANVITAGAAVNWNWSVLLCAAGNFVGSVLIAYLLQAAHPARQKAARRSVSRRKK